MLSAEALIRQYLRIWLVVVILIGGNSGLRRRAVSPNVPAGGHGKQFASLDGAGALASRERCAADDIRRWHAKYYAKSRICALCRCKSGEEMIPRRKMNNGKSRTDL